MGSPFKNYESITFTLHSRGGDQGFPGALDMEVKYTLTENNEIKIEYYSVPSEDTIINMTNHSYFNLNGHDSGSAMNQEVGIAAEYFTKTDIQSIPTGEIVAVEDTPMDFRVKKPLGRDIEEQYEPLIFGRGYDHNWVLENNGKFDKVAEMSSNESGIVMEVYTDLPGMQLYTGNFVENEIGKMGRFMMCVTESALKHSIFLMRLIKTISKVLFVLPEKITEPSQYLSLV